MVEIRTGNSFSTIVGLTVAEFSALKKVLSYTPPSSSVYFSGGYCRPRPLIDKKGAFPSGLLQRVRAHLGRAHIRYVVKPSCGVPTASRMHDMSLGGLRPYPDQIKAVNVAAKAHRGTISMATGYGKSITMALLIGKLQVKTLVVVPTLELKRQLAGTFSKIFGTLKNITVENIDSARLKKCTDYDCLIIDEVHHAAARTYHRLNRAAWGKIYYRFGFTATPFRNQAEEQILLECVAGDAIYEVSYKKASAQGAVVPVDAYYYNIPKTATDAYTWREVYDELIVGNTHRNNIIADLLLNLQAAEISTLCLVKEVNHGKALSALTGCPFVHGQDDKSKDYIAMFTQGDIKVLIGTAGILGEGVDTKPCEYVIVAGLGKAKSAFMQQVGRGVRKYAGKDSCKVVLFRDASHKFTLQHFKIQAKILKDEFGAIAAPLN